MSAVKKKNKKTIELILVREVRYPSVLEPKRLNKNVSVNMKISNAFFCRSLTEGLRIDSTVKCNLASAWKRGLG